ncbi:hypothetical protein [Mesorhizobium sp. WSM3864]|uniref:hypothetical protein n=1 Tax=Mesorhizobium sp. WSM3864 TaxID=2029404 RepID=UPI001140E416|nr:hypothetical protein [Mesorhizobium sp. WSM3864]
MITLAHAGAVPLLSGQLEGGLEEVHEQPHRRIELNGMAEDPGQAHAYRCEWDYALDDWSWVFLLSPIDDGQLAAVKENWLIWRGYQGHQANGRLQTRDRHPALAVIGLATSNWRTLWTKL